jgi:hypothetical protein
LYLDPRRHSWVIREGPRFIRTGISEADVKPAQAALARYKEDRKQAGFIYFLTAAHPDYPIKIGFTQRLSGLRLRAIQTSCPYALEFLARMRGVQRQERELHERFDHLRLRGEWFSRSPELLAYIETVGRDR